MAQNNRNHITLLIVEDEEVMRRALSDELRDEGFQVLTASNGQEGLDLSLSKKPDLILLDIIMPVMDGMAMMSKLREEKDWGEKVPIIFLTNLSADEKGIIEAVAKDKPAYYLVKSDWSLADVIEKIKDRLGIE